MSKKKLENSLLAVLGIALVVTSVILLVQKKQPSSVPPIGELDESFSSFDQNDRGLHVFSESGILL